RATFLVALALTFLPNTVQAAPIDIGADRQLLIDDTLVDLSLSRNVVRTVNPPESIRRVLEPDQPWEALGFIFYCSVVDDDGAVNFFTAAMMRKRRNTSALRRAATVCIGNARSLG